MIQIGGGSRDLYYYPKDTILVTVIAPKLNKGELPGTSVGVVVCRAFNQDICPLMLGCSYRRSWTVVVTFLA